ncbi:MAG: hypothetical protein EX285_08130 [Thaumarchaeota archaeon]|nr:hypothetical protein [Nitrososphaerota archaeon]
MVNIYTVNTDGSGATKLTEGNDPSFSSDGKKIVYNYDGAIRIMDSNGDNILKVMEPYNPVPHFLPR